MVHRIAIGPDIEHPYCEFSPNEIYSISMINEVDIVGTELTIDQLVVKVRYLFGDNLVQVIAPSDKNRVITSDGFVLATNRRFINPRLLSYGTVLYYFQDDVLVSKMYIERVVRVASHIYEINAMSAIGLLETQKHLGNVYRGKSFEDVVGEIIDGAVGFTIEDDVKHLQVYGWLPYDTKRANLHQLLFPNGVMVDKDSNGNVVFRFISNRDSIAIPKNRIYQGGQVDYQAFASEVDVTEHSFFALPTDEVVTVYDNTDGSETADHTFIAFTDAPLHDLETTGTLVIEDSGVNWAIVTGTGILTGKKYTHSTRVMRLVADNADQQKENVVTLSDAYLINVTNSDNVARRILAYYNSSKTVTASILTNGEKCGDLITGFDSYGDPISGFIASMRTNVSSVAKSECKIITDYIPTGQGSNYTHAIVLTGEGTWEIPPEVFEKENPIIQVSVISGGHGGFRGHDGEPRDGGFDNVGLAKDGGEGGEPGQGGRVITVIIDCTGQTSFGYNCGEGGESEQEGADTHFGEYSSEGGVPSPFGVANIFTGEIYGTPGVKGIAGGKGSGRDGDGPSITYNGSTWYPGEHGTNVSKSSYAADGGFGGGAAVGSNGGRGSDGDLHNNPNGTVFASGGSGGKGADGGSGDDSTLLGGGGGGGHGGGGGGEGGAARGSSAEDGASYESQGYSGDPGIGGPGGKGGSGLIIIYF